MKEASHENRGNQDVKVTLPERRKPFNDDKGVHLVFGPCLYETKAPVGNMPSVCDKILVVENDKKLSSMLVEYLCDNGYDPQGVASADAGLNLAKSGRFAIIILDVMLPDYDGFEFCRRLRVSSNTPIIMLTAKGDPFDRILGLELGADDYLSKPFEPRELLARIRAILRRGGSASASEEKTFGRLSLSKMSLTAKLGSRECALTLYQFQILYTLAENPGRTVTRDTLMNALKGQDLDVFDRSIDVHISRIRAEIEDDVKNPKRIVTVRGIGYMFSADQD